MMSQEALMLLLSDYLISLVTLSLLLLNLIRVVHAAAPSIKSLHTVHHLREALHILGLLLVHHNWVDQVEVHQADHLILCGLIECMLDVPAMVATLTHADCHMMTVHSLQLARAQQQSTIWDIAYQQAATKWHLH